MKDVFAFLVLPNNVYRKADYEVVYTNTLLLLNQMIELMIIITTFSEIPVSHHIK